MKEHKPTDELIKRASVIIDPTQRQQIISDILTLRDRYAGTVYEFKAPNGQPSRLISEMGTELGQQAWYAVRTPAFKDWFGDWEKAARISGIESLEANEIKISDPKNKKETESIARSFKQIKNKNDGRIAEIPVNAIGKIIKHKGYNITKIIESIPSLYETSLLVWSEQENRLESRKAHPNVKGYRNYINKFADGEGQYYIRFTLTEEKAKPSKVGESKIRSTTISDIDVYKKGDHSQRIRDYLPGRNEPTALYDKRLTEFFNSVNPKSISKIIDEQGEPKPVFHGTNKDFDIFITANKWGYGGTHFSSNKNVANVFAQGNKIYDAFINIRKPLIIDAGNKFFDLIPRPKEIPGKGTVDTFELAVFAKDNNYDGVVIDNVIEHGGVGTNVIAFDPCQIKSASANIGTYSCDNLSFTDINENNLIMGIAMPGNEKSNNGNKKIFPDNMAVSDDGKRVFVDILNQIDGSFGWMPIEKVKEYLQAQNSSLEGRDNNNKEIIMSDLNEVLPEEKNRSPDELAFENAVYKRNMVAAALKDGTLCCLPGKDGYADITPALNIANHNVYHGDNLLYLKEHQRKNDYPTGEYLTQAQIEKAREDVPGLSILKGQKGVSIHYSEFNDETEKWDTKHIRLFNIAQLGGNGPSKIKQWVDDKRLEYFQSQHGTKIQPPEPGQKPKGPEIVCSSSDPVKYLGQYFAAVSKGVPFKVDKDTAEEFSKNMGDSLYAQGVKKDGTRMVSPKDGITPVTDPFKLSQICREASKYCKEFMRDLGRQQNQEQKQEQQLPRKGHSR